MTKTPTMLAGGCHLERRQVVTLSMSGLDAIAAALREIGLNVQHHDRINERAGLPPVLNHLSLANSLEKKSGVGGRR